MRHHSGLRPPPEQMHAIAILNFVAAPFRLLQSSVELLAINQTDCRVILLCLTLLDLPSTGSSYMVGAGGGCRRTCPCSSATTTAGQSCATPDNTRLLRGNSTSSCTIRCRCRTPYSLL